MEESVDNESEENADEDFMVELEEFLEGDTLMPSAWWGWTLFVIHMLNICIIVPPLVH